MTPDRTFLALAAALLLAAAPAGAAPTPAPGGANQVSAVAGAVGQTLFNGVVRLTVQSVQQATDPVDLQQLLPSASQKPMAMTVLVKNGTHATFTELLVYTLSDADGVSFTVPDSAIRPNPVSMIQGAAARQRALFTVDPSFVPVKLVVQCTSCHPGAFRAFRIALPATAATATTPP